MREAMISTEDRRFRSHIGVDPIGIARALVSAVAKDHRVSATSTITQQLARNIFLPTTGASPASSRKRILALALERKFTKDQILELYLNRVYFGGGAYGIDAGIAALLRSRRRSPQPRRGGDHRRSGQGAVQLFADRRRRGGAGPRRASCCRRWRRTASSAKRRPRPSIRRKSGSSRRPSRTASATSPTGRCRSSTR